VVVASLRVKVRDVYQEVLVLCEGAGFPESFTLILFSSENIIVGNVTQVSGMSLTIRLYFIKIPDF
jgi:hypothetical protein